MSETLELLPRPHISEAYFAACELGVVLGIRDMARMPVPWVHQVDARFRLIFNGSRELRGCSYMGMTLPPMHLLILSHGWACGLLGLTRGDMLPGHEDAFIAACNRARDAAEAGGLYA